MKKIFISLLFLFISLGLCGCKDNRSLEEKFDLDIELDRENIQIKCILNEDLGEGERFIVIETANFDEEQLMINRKVKSIEQYDSDDDYIRYKESYENNVLEDTETTKYKYQSYDKEKTLVRVTAETKIDKTLLGDSLKNSLTANYYIKVHEQDKYSCEIEGITRQDLGL